MSIAPLTTSETEQTKAQPKILGPAQNQGPWDVIVIGSGIGGLSCAAALSKYGKKVLILEQHYIAGGFTHTFSRKGFTWDVGVHCVGEMGEKEIPGRLVRWLSNNELEFVSLGKVYETFHFPDNQTITFPDTWQGFKQNLCHAFPNDHTAIDRYFDLVWKVSNGAKTFFALKILPEWLDRAATPLLRLFQKDWWSVTTKQVLDSLTQNEKLKTVLAGQWGYYGSTPSHSAFAIHACTARHFWNGGYYPKSGSQQIADTFLKSIYQAGGQIMVRAGVNQILIKNKTAYGVELENGEQILAKKIVSATSVLVTAQKLLPEEFKSSAWGKDISKLKQSPPHLCLNLGFEGDIETVGATKSNQWFFESWSNEIKEWDVTDQDSEAPILYVSFPSLKDPTHIPGPQNRHTGEVVTFVPWKSFERWQDTRRGKRTPEYRDFKKELEDRMLKQIQRHMPELMNRCVFHELSTPLSTTFFTRAPQGAIYGLEATPERFGNKRLRTRTPIKNLYLAGGDVATLGVTGAMVGGVLCAGTIQPRVLRHIL